jgi:preprotein translocase subunit SecE
MSQENKSSSSKASTIIAIIIFIASLAIFYVNPLGFETALYKALILLSGVAIALVVFLSSSDGTKFKTFLSQTKIELRKVVWPNKDETVKTTIMIIIAVIVVSIFLWLVDSLFSWMVSLLMA